MRTLAILGIVISALLPDHAGAWPSRLYTDAEIVERAELIVLAHIKEGSITRVVHITGRGRSYEHRATLIVSRVIKGEFQNRELPFIIHYGLLPVPARYKNKLNDFVAKDRMPPYERQEAIRIYEDNPSEGYFRPSDDIHKEQIWLLRRQRIAGAREDADIATTGLQGIWDPEDIQSPSKEQQLRKHLQPK